MILGQGYRSIKQNRHWVSSLQDQTSWATKNYYITQDALNNELLWNTVLRLPSLHSKAWVVGTIRNIDFSPPLCASNWGHGLKVTRNINFQLIFLMLIAFVIDINYWVPSPTCIKPDRDGVEGQGLPINAVQGVGLVDHGRPPVPGLGQGRLVTRVTTLIAHCGAQQSQVGTLPE